jgi:Na+/proline symporter
MLPVGLKGLAIAALLSGFLATFNSTVNGGASYLVKDIYHKYIKPSATQRQLVVASYFSSALLIALGIVIAFKAQSINQMFTWIMGTLGAGVLLPNVLRWYWWRLNGWGYASATLTGMALSLVQVLVPAFKDQPLYITFPIIVVAVKLVAWAVSICTEPTDMDTLKRFYRTVQPWGLWGPVARAVQEEDPSFRRRSHPAGDLLNVALGLPCLLCMYTFPIYLILHRNLEAGALLAVTLTLGVALYFTWYRRLRMFEDE